MGHTIMTEKNIFRVEFSGYTYVWAEDEADARDEAGHLLATSAYSADDIGVTVEHAEEVDPGDEVETEWATGIPFGEPPEGFVDLIMPKALEKLSELPPDPPEPDPNQLPLPGLGDDEGEK